MIPSIFASSWFNDIEARPVTPTVITEGLCAWMRHHFSDELSDRFPSDHPLSRMIWNKNSELTKIVIEPITNWTPQLTEVKPGIFIKRLDWKRIKLGLGDTIQPISGDLLLRTNLWYGQHALICTSYHPVEVELLSNEVYIELNQFSQEFRKLFCLVRFEVVQIGELVKIEEAKESFMVPIVVHYVAEEAWKIISDLDLPP
ncbi:MAG: hypothetical protein QXV52_08875 [Nitrososphaeria archaeon]